MARSTSFLVACAVIAACSSSSSTDKPGGDGGVTGHTDAGGTRDARGGPDAKQGGVPDAALPKNIDAASVPDAPSLPPALACHAPDIEADVSTPTTVVGHGASTCTEAALDTAVAKGGVVTFDCGASATITLTKPLVPPSTTDTVIDGGGTVTLDGGGTTRILAFTGPGYRTTHATITLQHLDLQHGKATGTAIPAAPAPCSQGFQTDAGGGAVYVVDAQLHVFDATFTNNTAATPGPDVGGGAIYVNGSLGTVIVGSRFAGNTGSNGGAVGSLNADLAIYSSTLEQNTATGSGQNTTSSMCTTTSQEVGDGGSGAAVYMDGGSDGASTFCGDIFSGNHANALGGAIFRVFDTAQTAFNVEACTFDSNVADGPAGTTMAGSGAGAFYVHNGAIRVTASTFSNNSSLGCGAIQLDTSTFEMTNDTFSANTASDGVGGGVCAFSTGTFTNCTFAGNQALGGTSYSNYYSAAIFGSVVTLTNTILANNTTMNSEGRMTCGATETGTNNLQWPTDKVTGGSPDSPCVTGITFADPKLGALANNGGPTDTMAPGAAKAVVQVGTGCPATDQTGKARKTPCTIGAFEAE
jgi:predicted outer membrane repeat protein